MKCKNCEIKEAEKYSKYSTGEFCDRKCARGYSTKLKRKDINKKVSEKLKFSGHKDISKVCKYCKIPFNIKWINRKQKYCSRKCGSYANGGWQTVHKKLTKEDWSRINKKSYQNGNNYVAGGTCKWYSYKDIKVQGTYEYRTCKILDNWKIDNKIKNWEYTNDKIQYTGIDGKLHSYLLDFKVFRFDGSFYYIETKGYEKPNDKFKWQAVIKQGLELLVWFDKDIRKREMVYVA